jgi:hypothetical protein
MKLYEIALYISYLLLKAGLSSLPKPGDSCLFPFEYLQQKSTSQLSVTIYLETNVMEYSQEVTSLGQFF